MTRQLRATIADLECDNAALRQQILDAINILDGNDDPIEWRDYSHPELLRKLCEHLEAFDLRRGLHNSPSSEPNGATTGSALRDCHDCGAKPGNPHARGCDTERCSVCGGQRLVCGCKGHDRAFARWTGIWPGAAESASLGIDLNEFHRRGLHRVFFVKPNNALKC